MTVIRYVNGTRKCLLLSLCNLAAENFELAV